MEARVLPSTELAITLRSFVFALERLVASSRLLTPKGPKSLEQSFPDRKRAIVPRVRSTACGWRSFGSIQAQSRGKGQLGPAYKSNLPAAVQVL